MAFPKPSSGDLWHCWRVRCCRYDAQMCYRAWQLFHFSVLCYIIKSQHCG